MITLYHRLTYWGLFRQPLRTTLLILAIAGAVSSYVLIDFATRDMAAGAMTTWRGDAPFDLIVAHVDAHDRLSAITALAGIRQVEPTTLLGVVLATEVMQAVVPVDDSILAFEYIEGRAPLSGKEIAITGLIAERLALAVGDKVLVSSTRDLGKAVEFIVCGIIPAGPGMPTLNVLTHDGVERITAAPEQYGTLLITLDGQVSLIDMQRSIRRVLSGAQIQALADQYEGIARGTGIVELLVSVLQSVVFLVCAACVFALFYLALRERSHELGIMRAIGHSKTLLLSVLAGEGAVIATAASGLGLAVVWGVCTVVPHLADRFDPALYLPAALWFIAATMIFVLLAGHLVFSMSIPSLMNDELGTR